MGRRALRAALAAEKGVDYQKLKEKKKFKQAQKEKTAKAKKTPGALIAVADEDDKEDEEDEHASNGLIDDEAEEGSDDDDSDDDGELGADLIAAMDDSDESDSEVEMEPKMERPKKAAPPQPTALVRREKKAKAAAEEEDEDEDEDEDEEEVDWSDLDEEERAGLAVRRRQTIYNATALAAALARIRLPTDGSVPFSTHQTVLPTGASAQLTAAAIADIQDEDARERALSSQCRAAALVGRRLLRAEGVPFTRPTDYFAEMVKDDEHMQKIQARLVEKASAQKASADARRQRDLKKFGKQVQVTKMQERAKAKKETLEKIKTLKRKRSETGATNTHESDLFDVAVDNEIGAAGSKRGAAAGRSSAGAAHQPNAKRQKKNEKFGFGGKKRHAKSGDAVSSGDVSGFSARRMKSDVPGGRGGRGGGRGGARGGAHKAQRPGKARRQAASGRR